MCFLIAFDIGHRYKCAVVDLFYRRKKHSSVPFELSPSLSARVSHGSAGLNSVTSGILIQLGIRRDDVSSRVCAKYFKSFWKSRNLKREFDP